MVTETICDQSNNKFCIQCETDSQNKKKVLSKMIEKLFDPILLDVITNITLYKPESATSEYTSSLTNYFSITEEIMCKPTSQLFMGHMHNCVVPIFIKLIQKDNPLETRQLRQEYSILRYLNHEFHRLKLAFNTESVDFKNRYNQLNNYTDKQILELKNKMEFLCSSILNVIILLETDSKLALLTEYLNGPDLCQYLIQQPHGCLTEDEAKIIIRKVLHILIVLQQLGCVHRDIKLPNLVLRDRHNLESVVLIDFGFAVFSQDTIEIRRLCGSPGSCAPEILLEDKRLDPNKIDVFSLGIVLYTLLSGYPPFTAASSIMILRLNCRAILSFDRSIWKNISLLAIDLIISMTKKDPSKRISVSEALRHPWFNN